jgi:two-component system sensor histidine kinase BaeS
MSTTPPPPAVPAPAGPPVPAMDQLFGSLWPEASLAARPRLVVAALGVGLLAALALPGRSLGVGTFVVLMSGCAVVATADRRLLTPYHLTAAVLCTLLISMVFVRDAGWVVALCLLAALAVGTSTLVGSRTLAGIVLAGTAIPLAAVRGMPWLGRSVTLGRPTRAWLPAVRTAAVSSLLVLVFGALFASADALFASWVDAAVPDLSLGTAFVRGFVTVAFAGLTLTGVYVALNPPTLGNAAVPLGSAVRRPWEWLVPVGLVVATFALFVLAQLAVMFGGHSYLQATTGLTYADYVHQGFWQLMWATLLTLVVVAVAAAKAPRDTVSDRTLLRLALGVLCLLTLVVVASALYRMSVYEEAYGFTSLRLLVSVFEGWLGLVVLLVMVGGALMKGGWLPRAVLLTGAASLLALALANPDAMVARHNLDRYAQTGKVDRVYLQRLSADAVPTLAAAGVDLTCMFDVASLGQDDWLEWNLGRSRAAHHPGTDLPAPTLDLCGRAIP